MLTPLMWRRYAGNFICSRSFCSSSEQKTPLYDLHLKHEGKMVNFAGFSMPVQYGSVSITASHLHTRSKASLFDVSHMLQTEISGKHREEFLESLCVADIQGLETGKGTLSLFTNDKGGIVDDLIATKTESDSLFVVSNASRRDVDVKLMLEAQDKFKSAGKQVHIRFYDPQERALIALQGPKSKDVLSSLVNIDLSSLFFMQSKVCSIAGIIDCKMSRAGYTGEDGVEISVPGDQAVKLAQILMANENVLLAGLGARDSLRLEAGLCLYGNDMDESTSPVEAGLTWTIGKRRRETRDFPGAKIILDQIKNGVSRKRTGFVSTGVPIRQGYEIFEKDTSIGHVTSGCPSPSLKNNVAMGYVQSKSSKIGTELQVKVRDKFVNVKVVKMPFVKSNYYTPSK